MMLARIARADPELLHPIEHGTQEAQHHLMSIKLRDALVRSRVALINAVRFTLKSLCHSVSNPASQRFHKTVLDDVPAECAAVIAPMIETLKTISDQIAQLERQIEALGRKEYPVARHLQQIDGVGPVTSFYFVLKVGDPQRFQRTRDIGAYLGLCPKRDQSGGTDKQLGIAKCGDRYLRCLLVNAAQNILGPFGPPSALKEHGMKIMGSGTARGKKRAVIAIALKLAVLMLSLWRSGEVYEHRAATPTLIIERASAANLDAMN